MLRNTTEPHLGRSVAACRRRAPRRRARWAALSLALLTLGATTAASAGLPKGPMRWASKGFAKHSEAVEHLTLRGATSAGQRTFIRFSVANAGYRKGKLTITVQQRTASGTVYGKQTFKRGAYTVFKDRFGLRAGDNLLEVRGGKLHMQFSVGAAKGTAVLTPRGRGLRLKDRGPSGWIRRDVLSPWASVKLDLTGAKGARADLTTTVFAVHEASTIKAHRVYNHVVQLHRVRGNSLTVVDYLVAPKERGRRVLGFVILRGRGQRFVGAITAERRLAQRKDARNGYQVPWRIEVDAARGTKQAQVVLQTARQVSRKDDLAKLGFFTRKAVSLLIHPFTYGLAGTWEASVRSGQPKPAAAAVAPAGPPAVGPAATQAPSPAPPAVRKGTARFKYAQAR